MKLFILKIKFFIINKIKKYKNKLFSSIKNSKNNYIKDQINKMNDPSIKEKRICKKCGEIYRSYNYLWQIFRSSGIPYVKDEYSVAVCENGIFFYFPPSPLKLNSTYYTYYVNYHDEAALNEIDNNRCIMKGCDGKLEKFEGDEFEEAEKKKR